MIEICRGNPRRVIKPGIHDEAIAAVLDRPFEFLKVQSVSERETIRSRVITLGYHAISRRIVGGWSIKVRSKK